VLTTLLRDVTRAHVLKPNGTYVPAESVETDQPSVDAQDLLLEWYTAEHQAATDTAM
jgi:hypothetical protein